MNSDNFTGEYRTTRGGGVYFRFRFVRQSNGEVLIYILSAPSYGSRPNDGHSTHRYYDSHSDLYYICYEPMPLYVDDAINVAKAWAERTVDYIIYGWRF